MIYYIVYSIQGVKAPHTCRARIGGRVSWNGNSCHHRLFLIMYVSRILWLRRQTGGENNAIRFPTSIWCVNLQDRWCTHTPWGCLVEGTPQVNPCFVQLFLDLLRLMIFGINEV